MVQILLSSFEFQVPFFHIETWGLEARDLPSGRAAGCLDNSEAGNVEASY
jgi:hypothetical protein